VIENVGEGVVRALSLEARRGFVRAGSFLVRSKAAPTKSKRCSAFAKHEIGSSAGVVRRWKRNQLWKMDGGGKESLWEV
jgi:hypothetical protein